MYREAAEGEGPDPSWQLTEKVGPQDMQVHAIIDLGKGLKPKAGCDDVSQHP